MINYVHIWLYIKNDFYRYLYYRRYYVFFEHPIWIDFWGCCCSHGNIVHYVLTDPCFSIMTGPAIAYIFPRPDFSMPFNVWGPRQSGGFPFWPLGYETKWTGEAWNKLKTTWTEMKWWFTILLFGWTVILQGCSFIVNGAKLSLDNGGIGERRIFCQKAKKKDMKKNASRWAWNFLFDQSDVVQKHPKNNACHELSILRCEFWKKVMRLMSGRLPLLKWFWSLQTSCQMGHHFSARQLSSFGFYLHSTELPFTSKTAFSDYVPMSFNRKTRLTLVSCPKRLLF